MIAYTEARDGFTEYLLSNSIYTFAAFILATVCADKFRLLRPLVVAGDVGLPISCYGHSLGIRMVP